jgi:hypothetical protein
MDCTRARTGLWPPERPRLVVGDVAAARAHVRACENCTAYFAQDRALLDLYDRARRTPAPLPVREHVFDALARARSATVRSRSEGSRPGVLRASVHRRARATLAPESSPTPFGVVERSGASGARRQSWPSWLRWL